MHMKTALINSAGHKTQEDMKDNKLSGKRKLGREDTKSVYDQNTLYALMKLSKNSNE